MATRSLLVLAFFCFIFLWTHPAEGQTWSWDTFLDLRGGSVESQASWLEGGFGRLSGGGDAPGEQGKYGRGQLRLGASWEPSPRFRVFAHGLARWEEAAAQGNQGGLVEAYAEGLVPFGSGGRLRVRAGQFFLPTSMENVEALWTSPYTLSLSSVNSWIAEELRPIGVDSDLRWEASAGDRWSAGATVFGGNDSLGALLAWRGWSLGERLTVTGEVLPLPPLDSLQDDALLGAQRDEGTRPFGDDLDGRPGWSGRLRWQRPDRALVQLTWVDNRGDRQLYDDEYAWATDFGILGVEVHPAAAWTVAGEYVWGSSGMGDPRERALVDLDFEAAYLLASRNFDSWRLTLRFDHFSTDERDGSFAEINDEEGESWTAALFWHPSHRVRIGTELLWLDAERPAAAQSGFDLDTDALAWTVELRLRLGSP